MKRAIQCINIFKWRKSLMQLPSDRVQIKCRPQTYSIKNMNETYFCAIIEMANDTLSHYRVCSIYMILDGDLIVFSIQLDKILSSMEEGAQKPKASKRGRPRKVIKCQLSNQQKPKKIQSDHHPSSASEDEESSSESESEEVELAIKSMKFRSKRGTKMKNLMKGKPDKDKFWETNAKYFGGDLNKEQQPNEDDQYEASSSGRDEFDSDFNDTDSYAGKRGRKKGFKIKRKSKTKPPIKKEENQKEEEVKEKKKRGRPKKNAKELLQNKSILGEIKVEESYKSQKQAENCSSTEIKKEVVCEAAQAEKNIVEDSNESQKNKESEGQSCFRSSPCEKNLGSKSQSHIAVPKSPLKKQEDAFISSFME